ncbi:unnamed protein product [Allacma fusca]|uniref:Uncharacterized protein n=1 Tax=Allacma fusca TaxID=39272 RepID=A0A8J2PMS4_9HEXA|nr:unnamed protein product [Allacma fusca]
MLTASNESSSGPDLPLVIRSLQMLKRTGFWEKKKELPKAGLALTVYLRMWLQIYTRDKPYTVQCQVQGDISIASALRGFPEISDAKFPIVRKLIL